MSTAPADSVRFLVRLAPELTTKSRRTRRRFQGRLVGNIKDALGALGGTYRVDDRWTRILVDAQSRDAPELIARVFGVSSVSVIDATVPPRLDAIVAKGLELYRDDVRASTSYAVAA